ncbi:hypothetical protein ACEPAF_3391 [Sanghuangporus sanghuang]
MTDIPSVYIAVSVLPGSISSEKHWMTYHVSQDHSEPVLRSHSSRTAANSAAYLVNSGVIKPDARILDIGCGPGTITADLAALAPQGHIIGIEPEPEVLDKARSFAAERGLTNIEFNVGNIFALDFPDDTFDVVHVHQVLQHLADPIQALREMRRVTKPGGTVAAREGEVENIIYYPDPDGLIGKWMTFYTQLARLKGGEPHAGRRLLSWSLQVGFLRDQIKSTASVWCYNTSADRDWWSSMYADRILKSSFKQHALESGLATEADLIKYAEALRNWGAQEDGWLAVLHGEVLCRK